MKIWEIGLYTGKLETTGHQIIKETEKTIVFRCGFERTLTKRGLDRIQDGHLFSLSKGTGLEAAKTQLKDEILLRKEEIVKIEGLIAEIERELKN